MRIQASNNNYYEGILQLRNCREEVDDYIAELIKKSKAFVSRIVPHKNGHDIYISDQHFLQNLGRKLRTRFGGRLVISQKLHTMDRQRSKRLYRITVLYRQPPFSPGQVILSSDKLILLKKIGRNLSGIDLETGNTTSVPYDEESPILKVSKTKVVKIRPQLEVMHPETFQPVPVLNPFGRRLRLEENVRVVMGKKNYVL